MQYDIRAAVEDDMPGILEIEHDAIIPPWSHGGILSEIYNDDTLFALAVNGEKIMGFIIMRRNDIECDMFQIAVRHDCRRLGIADALMQTAIKWARHYSLESIFLEVRKSNSPAIKLYKKYGFRQISIRKEYYTNPIEDAIVFALSIRD